MHLVVDAISSQRLTDRQTAITVGTVMYQYLASIMTLRGSILGEVLQYYSPNAGKLCLQRATQSGAFLGTSEMLLFKIMQDAAVMCPTPVKSGTAFAYYHEIALFSFPYHHGSALFHAASSI